MIKAKDGEVIFKGRRDRVMAEAVTQEEPARKQTIWVLMPMFTMI